MSPDWVKPDNTIGISCFSAKHAALRRKSKDWLARNPDKVSDSRDMFMRDLLFQTKVDGIISSHDLLGQLS
jgi:hypothetical protein